MKYLHTFLLLFLLSNYSSAQTFPKSNDFDIHERFIDIDTIRLNIKIKPWQKTVSGTAQITFTPLRSKVDSFFIHSVDFSLNSILLNGKKADYKYLPKGGMWIFPQSLLKERNSLSINYTAKPKKGMYFIGWDDKTDRRNKQIWTQGQGIDNRHWFPAYDLQDEKAIYDLKISFPNNHEILSNGKLISKNIDSVNTNWHFRTQHPMSSYLVMVGGGEYEVKNSIKDDEISQPDSPGRDDEENIEFQYYYYPEKESWNESTYFKTEEIMSFLEEEIGVKYPWDKYAQIPVSDFKHGAMENTEATVFSDVYLCNDSSFVDRNYLSVNAHEMAHHWFGDALTCESSKHHWLNEGFATYYQLLAIEKFLGEEDFLWEKKLYREMILEASKRDSLALAHPKAGTERFYYKGAFVLMMLEKEIGHDNFKKAIKNYSSDNIYKVVDTHTLISSFESSLDIVLDNYFKQWVFEYGEAKVKVSYFHKGNKRGIQFKQSGKIFDITIPVKLSDKNKTHNYRLRNEVDTMFFGKKIKSFEIDPNIEALAEFTVIKPTSFWKEQALKGSSSYSRWNAVKNLENSDPDKKLKIYSKVNLKEENYNVVSEIYSQIKHEHSKSAIKLKTKILKLKDIDLRKSIITQTIQIGADDKTYFEDFLNTKSYDLTAASLDLLCKSFPGESDKYLSITKNITGATIPAVRLSWLMNAVKYGSFTELEKQIFAGELVDYTSNSFEFNTRLLALQKLFEIQYFNKELLINLVNGASSFNYRLAGPYRDVLKAMKEQTDFKEALENLLAGNELNDGEKTALKKVLDK
ncbi:MAG: M1 family metallopeptidase [Bacteroidota bacterium]